MVLSIAAAHRPCTAPAAPHRRLAAPRPSAREPRQLRVVAAAAEPERERAAADAAAPAQPPPLAVGRRQVLGLGTGGAAILAGLLAGGAAVLAAPKPASSVELAPLGAVERVGGDKLVGLDPEQVKDILARNLREGEYFVTGDLTPEIFADDCRFRDPTNETQGLSRYMKALTLLFDASYSAVQLVDIKVTTPRTIEAEWRMGGYLRFPWHPRVEPFTGRTTYHLNEQGLIALQDQTWSITPATALLETFTPTPGVSSDIKASLCA